MAKQDVGPITLSRVDGWPKEIYEPHDAALRAFNDVMTGSAERIERAYLARDTSGAVVGACFVRWRHGWAFVDQLFVEERARGQGLGRRLLEDALADARSVGLTGAWIDTINPVAKALYGSLGFQVFGTLGAQPGVTAWWLSLRFENPVPDRIAR